MGYENSETTIGKLSARRIEICCKYFSVIILTSSYLKWVNMCLQQKYTRKIWIRLVKYSSYGVSDPSGVPGIVGKLFFLGKEIKLIRVSSMDCWQIVLFS